MKFISISLIFSNFYILQILGQPVFLSAIRDQLPVHRQVLANFLKFYWQLDYDQEILRAEIQYKPTSGVSENALNDWIAIGFSDYGSLSDADVCLFWRNEQGIHHLTDSSTNPDGLIVPNFEKSSQLDCQNFQLSIRPNGISFMFTRPFDTCNDEAHYRIEDGTTHLVWSVGPGGPFQDINGLNISDPQTSLNGLSRLRLLKVEDIPNLPYDTQNLDITHELEVPSDDTTYWCSVHKLPREFRRKHHVIQYEPVKTKGLENILHHMEVFHCEGESPNEDFPIWAGPCGSDEAPEKLKQCKKVLAAWAIGAGPFTYPKDAGLGIGGPDFNPYVMLEVHYNNQNKESGLLDHSGMRLSVTENLREFDAGILELGLIYSDKMAIPPHVENFPLNGYCVPQCTAEALPSNGITIFGSQLHTHGTGVRVATRHFRGGKELPEINRDNHYSTHFQEIRALREPKTVLPGDSLITTCWHSTPDRDNATVGGYGFSEEMCLNYVHYYPKIDLEICKSAISDFDLAKYFQYLHDFKNKKTDPFYKTPTENYNEIRWTPEISREILDVYEHSSLQMQCQAGNGEALPGYWSEVSKPKITQPLPKEQRHCPKNFDNIFLNKRPLLRRELNHRFKNEDSEADQEIEKRPLLRRELNHRFKKEDSEADQEIEKRPLLGRELNNLYKQEEDESIPEMEKRPLLRQEVSGYRLKKVPFSSKMLPTLNHGSNSQKRFGFIPTMDMSYLRQSPPQQMGFSPRNTVMKENQRRKRIGFTPRNIEVYRKQNRASGILPSLDSESGSQRSKRVGSNPESYGILKEQTRERRRPFEQQSDDRRKRIGQSMNEMKRSGQPMNEMKRAGLSQNKIEQADQSMSEVKRVGQPMNEMKRAGQPIDDMNTMSQHMNSLQKRQRLNDQSIKKARNTILTANENDINNMEVEVMKALQLLREIGRKSEDAKMDKRGDWFGPGKTQSDKILDQMIEDDGETQWSDYDSWGLDRKKKGLGSIV